MNHPFLPLQLAFFFALMPSNPLLAASQQPPIVSPAVMAPSTHLSPRAVDLAGALGVVETRTVVEEHLKAIHSHLNRATEATRPDIRSIWEVITLMTEEVATRRDLLSYKNPVQGPSNIIITQEARSHISRQLGALISDLACGVAAMTNYLSPFVGQTEGMDEVRALLMLLVRNMQAPTELPVTWDTTESPAQRAVREADQTEQQQRVLAKQMLNELNPDAAMERLIKQTSVEQQLQPKVTIQDVASRVEGTLDAVARNAMIEKARSQAQIEANAKNKELFEQQGRQMTQGVEIETHRMTVLTLLFRAALNTTQMRYQGALNKKLTQTIESIDAQIKELDADTRRQDANIRTQERVLETLAKGQQEADAAAQDTPSETELVDTTTTEEQNPDTKGGLFGWLSRK